MAPLEEFGRIREWTAGRHSDTSLAAAGVKLGIGDDTAVVSGTSGLEWLLAVDTMVEGVHFRPETMEPEDIGYKALAANISDIAAMGGIPKHALVAISIPPQWDTSLLKRIFDGLYECAERYGVIVVGGDTTSAPESLVISVTIVGQVEAGKAIYRNGARPGHFIFLTGPTGLSAGGLHGMLQSEEHRRLVISPPPKRLISAHRRPNPSVKAGRLLITNGWGASLNDVSDGVSSEAWEIAEASDVKLVLHEASLPLAGELVGYAGQCNIPPLDWVLYGGEDYVLIGTAERKYEASMRETFRAEGIPLFIIGEVEAGSPGVDLEYGSGKRKPLEKRGYNHFPKG
ncbi:MAG: thiamine-phosphate kinase [Candidatus Cohnella colombiensis]|uniref:Thiamine-monophosphate kinase n=1 Tax=Candidatus Cohnella colombiensis TaxID=3121368 RepID=A0AA95JGH1_9BACL|nr:MAG: thiamine-phosphate kinase [Cohnella sp.]